MFIGGVPRSGTTLLQHMLDCHSEVFGGPEFDCVPTILDTWRQVVAAHQRGRIRVFYTRPPIDACFARLIEGLLLPVADEHRTRLLSEKTPLNVLVFVELLTVLPGHPPCPRPRAVVSSLVQVSVRSRAKGEPAPDFVQDVPSGRRLHQDR